MSENIKLQLARVARDLQQIRSHIGKMAEDGGEGSGNFGHAGRPGEIGGSAPEGGGGGSGGGEAGKKATAHINGMMAGGLQNRKSNFAEASKAIADMPEGSVITGITDAGNRRDFVKGKYDTWNAKYQNTLNAKEERMDSVSVASNLLNIRNDNFGHMVSAEVSPALPEGEAKPSKPANPAKPLERKQPEAAISKQGKSKLSEIAKNGFRMQTLETQNSDQDDFHEVSVWSVKTALEDAYKAGNGNIAPQGLAEKIAKEHLRIPTLKQQRNDDKDFHEVSVWSTKAALEAAYKAGGGK